MLQTYLTNFNMYRLCYKHRLPIQNDQPEQLAEAADKVSLRTVVCVVEAAITHEPGQSTLPVAKHTQTVCPFGFIFEKLLEFFGTRPRGSKAPAPTGAFGRLMSPLQNDNLELEAAQLLLSCSSGASGHSPTDKDLGSRSRAPPHSRAPLCAVHCNGFMGQFYGGHDRDLFVRCT
ncbi:hypothetical protein WJX84_011020, partial [Apatococcus fuscideae]